MRHSPLAWVAALLLIPMALAIWILITAQPSSVTKASSAEAADSGKMPASGGAPKPSVASNAGVAGATTQSAPSSSSGSTSGAGGSQATPANATTSNSQAVVSGTAPTSPAVRATGGFNSEPLQRARREGLANLPFDAVKVLAKAVNQQR